MSDKEAVKALIAHRIRFMDDFGWDKSTTVALDIAIASLATESKLVVKGKWIHGEEVCNRWSGEAVAVRYYKDWHCSECGYIAAKIAINEPTYRFCPNCGADMREEANDER